MMKLILASKNRKLIVEMMDYIVKLPRIKNDERINHAEDVCVESPDDGTLYYYLKADCDDDLAEYMKGFCCGYMAALKFDNSK